jgi:organic radical activating enzyme
MDKKELLNKKHFCIQPFVHSCIWTDGRVLPCCINQHYHFGHTSKNSLDEIYNNNNEKLVEFRKEILNGPELPDSCSRCADMENNYADNSYRYYSNRHYGHLLDDIDINEDGTVNNNKVYTWDVRFSNLCNLKCRTCDNINSSKIAEEDRKYWNKSIVVLKEAFDDTTEFFQFFEKNIDVIEEIYFCGGEPLLLEEHYRMLDLLIEHKRFNTIIRYNTNATKLMFKDKNVVDDYWVHFPKVRLGLSLDAGWEQIGVIRHGSNWDTIVSNLRHIVDKCPHVFIQFSPTISILNIFHVARLHKFLAEEKLLGLSDVYFNILTFPTYYSITILPSEMKEKVKKEWEQYKSDLIQLGCNSYMEEEIDKVIKYMYTYNYTGPIGRFIEVTKMMDSRRNESTFDVFPELKDLL